VRPGSTITSAGAWPKRWLARPRTHPLYQRWETADAAGRGPARLRLAEETICRGQPCDLELVRSARPPTSTSPSRAWGRPGFGSLCYFGGPQYVAQFPAATFRSRRRHRGARSVCRCSSGASGRLPPPYKRRPIRHHPSLTGDGHRRGPGPGVNPPARPVEFLWRTSRASRRAPPTMTPLRRGHPVALLDRGSAPAPSSQSVPSLQIDGDPQPRCPT